MSAENIAVITIAFPDPALDENNDVFEQVDPQRSFQDPISSNIRTLSTNDAAAGSDITGLLYVPDLTTSACINASQPYVPANATRRGALPHNDYSLVAFAPWFSPECTLEYLASTQHTPTHAFIFYHPDSNSTDIPPLPNDPSWGLGDGGSWKSNNNFPVYAIPPFHGNLIMSQMNLYSKNVTEVPYGHYLVQMYPASDYIRLWTQISTSDTSKLPSLWVFLLITLGLLVLIIGGTSFTMHFLQRKRRRSLQRRIMNGEVDLEALGIKRLTVPQEILDKMPLHIYTMDPVPQSPTNQTDGITESSKPAGSPHALPAFSQPTCPICLDDFVPNETAVRELPCRHIFHPECVDAFLMNNSSLCPMCKNSTLPKGYCPSLITNAMVRRERAVRRARQRLQNSSGQRTNVIGSVRGLGSMTQRGPPSERHRLFREALAETVLGRNFGRRTGSSAATQQNQGTPTVQATTNTRSVATSPITPSRDIEMGLTSHLTPPSVTPAVTSGDHFLSQPPPSSATSPTTDPSSGQSPHSATDQPRSQWAQQRAVALLGNRGQVVDADEEEQRQPLWKRAIGKVWPGLT